MTLQQADNPGQMQVSRDTRAEFSHLHKYWHSGHNKVGVRVNAGEYYVSGEDEVIQTVLGSCISVCVHDPVNRIGGMNHFLLPHDEGGHRLSNSDPAGYRTRYGATAMEHLFNSVFKLGSAREQLQIKIFGGGNVLPTTMQIGALNATFARDYLTREGLTVVADDVEGPWSREVRFLPQTGDAFVRRLAADDDEIRRNETRYLEQVSRTKSDDDIELF